MKNKKGRFLTVFLIISLGFNVFFVLGFLSARSALRKINTRAGRLELIGRRLKLNEAQREKIIRLMSEQWAREGQTKRAYDWATDAYWAEMMKDNPDPRIIREAVERSFEEQKKFRFLAAENLQKIFKELTPEQRQKCANIIRYRSIFAE